MEVWRVLLIACFVSHLYAASPESCRDLCTRCSSESTIELHCPFSDAIQVLEKFIVMNCTGEDTCNATSFCVYRLPSSELRPVCNGRQLCNETVSELQDTLISNASQTEHYQVSYKCLSLSLTTNICGNDYVESKVIYLVTPDFPGLTSPVSRPLCRCRVQGESIAITAVQIDLPFNGSSLTLTDVTDNRTLWSSDEMQSTVLYNTTLFTGKGFQTVDIVFNTTMVRNQIVWIELRAARGKINYGSGMRETSVTPPPVYPLTRTMSPTPSATEDPSTSVPNTTAASPVSPGTVTSPNQGTTATANTSTTLPSSLNYSTRTSFSPSLVSEAAVRVQCVELLRPCIGIPGPPAPLDSKPGSTNVAEIVVPVLISLAVIVALVVICIFLRRRRSGQKKKPEDLERSAADNGDLYTRVAKSKPGVNKEPATPVTSAEKTVAEPEADVPGDGGVHISGADNVSYVKDALRVGEMTAHRSEGEQDAACGKTTEIKQTDRLKTNRRGHDDCLGYSEVEIPEDTSVPKLLEKNVSSQPQPENAKSDKDLADETVTSFNPSPQNNEEDARTESGTAEAPILKPELSLRSRPAEAHGNLPIMQDHTDGPLNHHYSEIDPVPKNNSTEPRTPAPPPTPHHYSDIELPDDIKIPDNSVFQGKKKSAKNPPHNYWVLEPQAEAPTKPVAKKPGTFNVEIVPLKRSKSVEPHPSEKNALQSRGASERQRVFDASRGQHSAMDTPVPNPAQRTTTLSNAYADIADDEVLALEPNSASRAPAPLPPLATAPTSSPGAPSHPAAAVAALATPQDPERDSYGVAHGYEPVEAGGNSPVKPLSSSEDRSVTASVSGLYEEIDKSKWDTATGAISSSAEGTVADAGTLQGGGAVNGRLLPQDPATSSPDKKEDVLVYNILYESFQNAKKKTEK